MLGTLYMVVVLGCSDDLARCEEIARVGEGWTSAAACERAVTDVLRGQTGADYPTVAARCERASAQLLAEAGATPAE